MQSLMDDDLIDLSLDKYIKTIFKDLLYFCISLSDNPYGKCIALGLRKPTFLSWHPITELFLLLHQRWPYLLFCQKLKVLENPRDVQSAEKEEEFDRSVILETLDCNKHSESGGKVTACFSITWF